MRRTGKYTEWALEKYNLNGLCNAICLVSQWMEGGRMLSLYFPSFVLDFVHGCTLKRDHANSFNDLIPARIQQGWTDLRKHVKLVVKLKQNPIASFM